MKRTVTLLIVLFFYGNAFAQRNADIKFNALTSPAAIHNGVPFTVTAHLKNLGPDAIKPADSIQLGFEIANSVVPNQWVTGISIAANDSLNVTDTLTFNYSVASDSSVIFCAVALLQRNVTSDSVIDNKGSNNESCNFVTLSVHGGVDVPLVASKPQITVYPNPFTDKICIANIGKESTIKIFDLMGRQLLNVSAGGQTQTINVNTLKRGIYILQLTNQAGQKEIMRIVKVE